MTTIDLDLLDRMVAERFVSRKVNDAGYRLYNYTQRAQYEGVWNPATLAARGLVLAPDGTPQSRPFAKFFNVEDHENGRVPPLPVEPFVAYEKLDGSLIVASRLPDGTNLVTSRGAFDSAQAVAAAKMLAGVAVPPGETWCLELVAPWNRIVVDYGDTTSLTLLARIDTATGDDLPLVSPVPEIPVVGCLDGVDDYRAIVDRLASLGPNEEGYVLRFESGVRVKAKGAEYKRLHKLLTGVTARTIWECLSSGSGLDEIVDRVPDEFHQWAKDTAAALDAQYYAVRAEATAARDAIVDLPTRRDQALAIKDHPHRAVIFALLDEKPYAHIIWRGLKPEPGRPFALDDAEVPA